MSAAIWIPHSSLLAAFPLFFLAHYYCSPIMQHDLTAHVLANILIQLPLPERVCGQPLSSAVSRFDCDCGAAAAYLCRRRGGWGDERRWEGEIGADNETYRGLWRRTRRSDWVWDDWALETISLSKQIKKIAKAVPGMSSLYQFF